MKVYISKIIVLLFLTNTLSAQIVKTHHIKSEINSLVIYLDGVEGTRAKNIKLVQGRNKLIFEGLSPKLNSSSIRVSATNNASILAISSKLNYLTNELEEEKITRIKDSLVIINKKITALNDETRTS